MGGYNLLFVASVRVKDSHTIVPIVRCGRICKAVCIGELEDPVKWKRCGMQDRVLCVLSPASVLRCRRLNSSRLRRLSWVLGHLKATAKPRALPKKLYFPLRN